MGETDSDHKILLHRLLDQHARALALDLHLNEEELPRAWLLALIVLHVLGLLAVARLTRQPWWLLLIPVLALQPMLVLVRRRRRWAACVPSLAPLGLAYLVALIRLVGRRIVPGWAPTAGWLNLDYVLVLAGLWTLTAQAGLTAQAWRCTLAPGSLLGVAFLVLALIWSVVTGLTLHTHGVTGTDPYAYAQMAVDLARDEMPLHVFSLVEVLGDLGVDPRPLVPLGYLAPDLTTGASATVWPPGQAALLALGYIVGGERGLYLTMPALGLLALGALWLLIQEALRTWPVAGRRLAGGVAVALLATSFEQVDRQLTPMADISAQLFSILALYWALRGARTRKYGPALLAGLCLGVAFDVRYTQVLLAPAVAWLLIGKGRERDRRVVPRQVVCCAVAALAAALPVLGYHQVVFGSPFSVGSEELALFSWDALRRTVPRMALAIAQAREFGYALPFVLLGAIQLWRKAWRTALGLLVGFGLVVAFQLPYEALRLRDLLPVMPIVALWGGVGLAELFAWVGRLRKAGWRTGLCAAGVLLSALLVCSDATLLLPVPPMHYNAFGYLVDTQRASLDTLAQLTPKNAVVAASLNAGAVTLYAERDIVRAGVWSEAEWLTVVDRLLAVGRPLYVLADGEEMLAPVQALEGRYRLESVGTLSLPYYYPGGGSENRDVGLYRVAE